MFKTILLVIACWMALAAQAAPVVMVYGDSLSSGYGLPQDKGWVSLLARRIDAEKLGSRVVNASISGETTLGGRNRIDATLARHRPDVVIIELGGNDGLRGLSLTATRENLAAIVEAVRRTGARALLVGMQLPPNYGTGYAKKFQSLFGEVATEKKVPLVPFMLEGFGEKRDFFQADGIHPSAEAQPLILDNIWPVLRPMLVKR